MPSEVAEGTMLFVVGCIFQGVRQGLEGVKSSLLQCLSVVTALN